MNKIFEKKAHIALLLSFLAIIVAALAISISQKKFLVSPIPKASSVTLSTDPFSNINLEAKAAFVVDLSDGKVLFEKNATTTYPLASLTKLISIIVATDFLPAETKIEITPSDLLADGDTGLLPGENWSLENLSRFTLITSSNDGITAIARVAGVRVASPENPDPNQAFLKAMDNTVAALGFSDMRFNNPSGLDVSSTTSGGYGSAKDIAGILSYLLKVNPNLIAVTGEKTTTLRSDYASHTALNTDEVLPLIPSIVASKTGYTDLAGGNLAIIMDAGLMHPVALVVLGSSYDGRFSDMEKMAEATITSLNQKGI